MPGTPPIAKDQSIATRAILLALLLAAANLWSIRHLGFGLEDPVGLLGLTGGVAAFSFLLDFIIGKDEQERLKQPIRVGIREFLRTWVLATPTLIVLYLMCGIAASMFSSITVIGATTGSNVNIEIAPLDDSDAKTKLTVSPGTVAGPIPYIANPFGRDLRISPAGYSRQTKTLFPLTGLTFNLDDFEPLPTLLLRPGPGALFGLKNGARYLIWKRERGKGCVEIANSDGKNIERAAIVGVNRVIPPDLAPLWRLELQSAGIADDNPNFAELMLAWQKPQPLVATEFLEARTELQIAIRQKNNLIGFADYVVGMEPFQDIPLTDGNKGFTPCQ